jgi:hypothetical protein
MPFRTGNPVAAGETANCQPVALKSLSAKKRAVGIEAVSE